MHEIAIGDPLAGYTVLQGSAITGAAFKATPFFTFSADPVVTETLEIQVKGSAAQITALILTLETIIQRAVLYENVHYAAPQYLRFQLVAAGPYYLTPISRMHLEATPAAFIAQPQGNKLLILTYQRPNYFDGPKTELPLTGRGGTDVLGGYPLINHTDSGVGHGSTVLIKKADVNTVLPAPLRFEYWFTRVGAHNVKDMYTGIFHHPTYDSDALFFAYYNDLTLGTTHVDATAIQGNFRRRTWTSAVWVEFTEYHILTSLVNAIDGRSIRPILRLFTTHAYTDLYFKVQVEHYGNVLYTSEAVHSPPGYGYIVLPPVEIPPNYLIREVGIEVVQVVLYAWRISGAATTVEFDCLTLFPLSYAATFYGFNPLVFEEKLVDDSFRERYNKRTSAAAGELVGHSRIGGPLLLFPGSNSRLFIYVADSTNLMPIDHTADLLVYYYPRLRLL